MAGGLSSGPGVRTTCWGCVLAIALNSPAGGLARTGRVGRQGGVRPAGGPFTGSSLSCARAFAREAAVAGNAAPLLFLTLRPSGPDPQRARVREGDTSRSGSGMLRALGLRAGDATPIRGQALAISFGKDVEEDEPEGTPCPDLKKHLLARSALSIINQLTPSPLTFLSRLLPNSQQQQAEMGQNNYQPQHQNGLQGAFFPTFQNPQQQSSGAGMFNKFSRNEEDVRPPPPAYNPQQQSGQGQQQQYAPPQGAPPGHENGSSAEAREWAQHQENLRAQQQGGGRQ